MTIIRIKGIRNPKPPPPDRNPGRYNSHDPRNKTVHDTTHAALRAGYAAMRAQNTTEAGRQLGIALRERRCSCLAAINQRIELALALKKSRVAIADLNRLKKIRGPIPEVFCIWHK